MNKDIEAKRDELAQKNAQREWDLYQEHLRLGGTKLHVRSFLYLGYVEGFDAGFKLAVEDVLPLLEALHKIVSHSNSWVITAETGALLGQVHREYREIAREALDKWEKK